ncbi:nickel-type superoxide dismutase maturation protease [Prochlorococcus sp. AH-716-J21]|nr:nickel-type superoxide dismutase maturation protease [Prochlorococcus sp. AH-716-J21]
MFKSFFDFILFFLGLRKIAIINGESMLPNLKEGDIVFFKKYKKNKSKLKNRQIVIFNHPFKNINLIKRINSINQNNIEVLGDNLEFSEDSNKFGLINNEKIIGIVTSKLIIPKLKNFLIQKNRSTSLNPK